VPRKRATALFIWLRDCIGLALLLSASCSRPSPVSAADFPPIPPGSARIWFYRIYDPTESKGRPYIYMNGAIVGISEQGYAFYRDVLAGLYHVSVKSYGRDLSIPRRCARPRTASVCENFISAELCGIGAELQS
jgi:hypothetical protein